MYHTKEPISKLYSFFTVQTGTYSEFIMRRVWGTRNEIFTERSKYFKIEVFLTYVVQTLRLINFHIYFYTDCYEHVT